VFFPAVQAEFYCTLKVGPDKQIPSTLHQFTSPTNRLPQSTYSVCWCCKQELNSSETSCDKIDRGVEEKLKVQEWGGRKSVSAWLEWIVVRKVSFSMSETGLGQKCLFQQEWFQMPLNIINVVAGSPVPF
jgi:hypothetical protein